MKNKKCKIKKILGSKSTAPSVILANAGIQARTDTQVRPYRKHQDAHIFVTPVKTGVHPHPIKMDTVPGSRPGQASNGMTDNQMAPDLFFNSMA